MPRETISVDNSDRELYKLTIHDVAKLENGGTISLLKNDGGWVDIMPCDCDICKEERDE